MDETSSTCRQDCRHLMSCSNQIQEKTGAFPSLWQLSVLKECQGPCTELCFHSWHRTSKLFLHLDSSPQGSVGISALQHQCALHQSCAWFYTDGSLVSLCCDLFCLGSFSRTAEFFQRTDPFARCTIPANPFLAEVK